MEEKKIPKNKKKMYFHLVHSTTFELLSEKKFGGKEKLRNPISLRIESQQVYDDTIVITFFHSRFLSSHVCLLFENRL